MMFLLGGLPVKVNHYSIQQLITFLFSVAFMAHVKIFIINDLF